MHRWPVQLPILSLSIWLVSCTAFLDFRPGRDADTPDDGRDIDADADRADEADAAGDREPDRDEGLEERPDGEPVPDGADVPDVPPDDGVEMEDGEVCAYPECIFDGSCHHEGESRPDNECYRCMAGEWNALPEGNPCGTAGICCDGTCHEDWGCCTEEQCPTSCVGEAVPCASMGTSPLDCESQEGCKANGPCGADEHVNCPAIEDRTSCDDCGCVWDGGTPLCIEGAAAPACSDFNNDYDLCTDCGCTFYASACVNYPGAYHCSNYTTQGPCEGQVGCRWANFTCSSHQCIET